MPYPTILMEVPGEGWEKLMYFRQGSVPLQKKSVLKAGMR